MRLRDRLIGLTPPRAPVEVPAELEPRGERGGVLASLEALEAERAQRITRLRALIGEVEVRTRADRSEPRARAAQALPFGGEHETPFGALHVLERYFEPHHQHGRVAVRDALRAPAALLAQLAHDPALAEIDLSRMLILDTETTGLAGGTGTVPFLIGLAWFEDGALKVEQLFLRELGGEAPLLRRVAERVRAASCLVTYNGKAFDWPLLRARFVLNRVPMPELPAHLDLLHCARRIWKPRLSSVRLPEVERALLGYYREEDIDGALIPGLYLGYLRGGDPRTLQPVFTHNEQDVVALAAIVARLCQHFEAVCPADDARDHLAYARVALRAGDVARARAFAYAAAAGSESADVAALAHAVCAQVARRAGDAHAAAECWQRALACCADDRSAARVHLALTRLYERQLRDVQRARHHAQFTLASEGDAAHLRRLSRLERRIERLARLAAARRTS
jgi:uncharacterized protein YprB with RNaseH-like and TPR domain